MTNPIPKRYAASHEPFAKQHMQHTSSVHPRAIRLGSLENNSLDWEAVGLCGLADRYMQECLDSKNSRYRKGVLVLHKGELLGHYKLGQYRTFLSWTNKTNEHEFLLKEGGLYIPSATLYENSLQQYGDWPAVHVKSLQLFPGRHARIKTQEAMQREKYRVMQSGVYQQLMLSR